MQFGERESLRERFESLSRAQLTGVATVAIVVVAGAGLWYVRSLPRPVEIHAASRTGPTPSRAPLAPVLIVDVAGWVRHPGVYRFHQGDRVIDAIKEAGGARRGADLTSINLAAPLVDGQQILVGRRGSPVESGPAGSPTGGAPAKVSINSATSDQLDALPGIGPVLAQRIIDYRTAHGPFQSIEDLDNVSGIGPAILSNIRSLVTL
jgi:competence protein ComEA